MKRFIVLFSFLLTLSLRSFACGPEPIIHNFYMMCVINESESGVTSPDFVTPLYKYWQAYTGKKEGFFDNDCSLLVETARRKHDAEMLAYVRNIAKYQQICVRKSEQWNYPSKAEVALEKAQLQRMRNAALNYKGSRLTQQYTLLLMRCYLLEANVKGILSVWNTRASRFPVGIYKEMCRNIYAYALLNSGHRDEALSIYVSQGDVSSIQWAARNFQNLDGIKVIYHENPNSPVLRWLVQNYVNTVQDNADLDWMYDYVGADNTQQEAEAKAFIDFAEHVVASRKSSEPALWKAASAMVSYTLGDTKAAELKSRLAMTMKGTVLECDNARAIHFLASTALMREGAPFDADFIVKELRFLNSKGTPYSWDMNYYSRVFDRVVTQNIIAYYAKHHNLNMVAAAQGMLERRRLPKNNHEYTYAPGYSRYANYDEYFGSLDSMTANQLRDYIVFMHEKHDNDVLAQFILQQNKYRNPSYFNDLLATKLIAEGRFSEALPVLKKVPLAYVNGLSIALYMAHRDYKKPRWFFQQRVKDMYNLGVDEELEQVSLKYNQKITFCEDMSRLEQRYQLANDATRSGLALQLAVRYYQASCYGDCWYLTHYDKLYDDSTRAWEKDFVQQAMTYLDVAKKDVKLKQEALYARAYVLNSITSNGLWWFYDEEEHYKAIKNDVACEQAYDELLGYIRKNPSQVADYVSRCDVIRKDLKAVGMAYSR